jgi:hypothetical protein
VMVVEKRSSYKRGEKSGDGLGEILLLELEKFDRFRFLG